MQPGSVLADRYELLGLLGGGAQSSVWEARDAQTGEHVAVKAVSLDEFGWSAEVRDRFEQEARLLTLASDEHLVGVRDVGETDDGYLFIVLEKLSGETLADRIARPPRPGWREAASIARQIAGGLSALHARGIVHRDLKPANVMLHRAPGGEGPAIAKIIDLGVSKARAAAADPRLYATLTATGQVLGTPEYMSYEQALGERDVDARCDVWALGVVLYEMLAGERPFEGGNVNAVLAAIRRGAPPALRERAREVPPTLAAVVERCLARAREARYADGAELAAALDEAIAQGEREDARRRRRRAGAIALAALCAVGAALLFGAWLGDREAPAPTPARVAPTAAPSVDAPRPEGSVAAPPTAPPTAATSARAAPTSAPIVPTATAKPGRVITKIDDAGF